MASWLNRVLNVLILFLVDTEMPNSGADDTSEHFTTTSDKAAVVASLDNVHDEVEVNDGSAMISGECDIAEEVPVVNEQTRPLASTSDLSSSNLSTSDFASECLFHCTYNQWTA